MVIADDEQVTLLIYGGVFTLRSLIVDEVTTIDTLEIRIHLHHITATRLQGVLTVVIHLVHLNGHVIIHTKGLRDRIIDKRMYCHVLATVVTENVRLIELCRDGREEGIFVIAVAVGVGHGSRVDGTGEVTLRGCHHDILEVHVLGLRHADVHTGLVADGGRNTDHGHIRLTGMGRADGTGNGNDFRLTLWSGYRRGVETRHLKAYLNAFLRGRNQLSHHLSRCCVKNGRPLRLRVLSKGHSGKYCKEKRYRNPCSYYDKSLSHYLMGLNWIFGCKVKHKK